MRHIMKRLLPSIPPTTSTKLSRSSNLFHSLGPDLGLGGVVGEESLCLLQEEVDFGERLVTDVLPADVTFESLSAALKPLGRDDNMMMPTVTVKSTVIRPTGSDIPEANFPRLIPLK